MPGLSDVRILVLAGPSSDPMAGADLDLLAERATTHVLPANSRSLLLIPRVLKRLLLSQDDVIVLHGAAPSIAIPVQLAAGLWQRPLLHILPGRLAAGRQRGRLPVTMESRQMVLIRAVAELTGRSWPAAGLLPLRIDLGCGSLARPGFLGIDARRTPATRIIADARAVAVRTHVADEVYASCLLEHFDDPHQVLKEIHRILHPEGQAVLRLPNLATYSAHLDTTHRFLADLTLWRRILSGYFEEVEVVPVGTKYRDNAWLVRVNWFLVNVCKWYELAQGWDFICRRPKAEPTIEYTGWWEE